MNQPIDPATLAVWEADAGHEKSCPSCTRIIREAIVEIRRLREELEQCHFDAGFAIPPLREALAAHRAVIRELAGVLEHAYTAEMAWGAQKSKALAHPLVVAAREGT